MPSQVEEVRLGAQVLAVQQFAKDPRNLPLTHRHRPLADRDRDNASLGPAIPGLERTACTRPLGVLVAPGVRGDQRSLCQPSEDGGPIELSVAGQRELWQPHDERRSHVRGQAFGPRLSQHRLGRRRAGRRHQARHQVRAQW